jgi:hypothetical protein
MRRRVLRASANVSAQEAHTISFQISNGAGRFACLVIADAPSRERAMELFEYNWRLIEAKARECLAAPCFDGGIKLVMA